MIAEMRKSGVEVVGDMPWGTRFCLLLSDKKMFRWRSPVLQSWVGKSGVLPVVVPNLLRRKTPGCVEASCS